METQQGNAQQLSALHVVSEGVELQMLRYVITDIHCVDGARTDQLVGMVFSMTSRSLTPR